MPSNPTNRRFRVRWHLVLPALLLAALAVLAVPAREPHLAPAPPGGGSFTWNRDTLWQAHEAAFLAARAAGCADTLGVVSQVTALRAVVDTLQLMPVAATAPVLDSVEARLFALTAEVAACPAPLEEYLALQLAHARMIKWQSRHWNMADRAVRDRIYRGLYGTRAASEEAMLQHPARVPALQLVVQEPSATPSALVQGVVLHSGDILVSRGGYPTSALIARGNDYPGNFSHIGLVHVDEETGAVSVIEAHIELGVAITTAEGYLADKKLRVMVMRPRADLPELVADPMLPHRAATAIRDRAVREHIRYDFAMDYRDPSQLFCSEVASSAYHEQGLELWMGISTISRDGLRRWLGSFGVKHFATQEPSDIEYDPQLVVVAEWRDPATLFDDHLANAVTDAMLEGADRGDRLSYRWHQLPLARAAKGYSWLMARVGRQGPIPEGMSAPAALRSRSYSARHAALAEQVRSAAGRWRAMRGYPPPYWTLVDLARSELTTGQ
ncbi:MAG: hypothetical protein U0974_11015 [Gemmatimonadales bacterium]|nr:hypothetical protein [Gemmatimonadales bacterium]MDZ4390243.1 hypothetical protein [Gemmatimonadales bacterium]